jgi:hypothetical protein
MLALLFLLGASLLTGGDSSATMNCTNVAAVHTQEVSNRIVGPHARVAFLRIFSEDDHSKNSHKCRAEYQLIILPLIILPSYGDRVVMDSLLSSNGDWDRKLSVHLDGFLPDGNRVFGTISEGGKYPIKMIFDYNAVTRKTKLTDIRETLKNLRAAKCGTELAVTGTTDKGAIVLEPRTADECRNSHRWLIDPATDKPKPLPQETPVIRLNNGNQPPL